MEDFFKDLKVIELAGVLAGPAAGMFFAELGAEVIKVENKPSGGDITRSWRLPSETREGPSAYYASVNYHKTILSLDLKSESDRQTLYKHIQVADLVISNFTEDTAAKLGVQSDSLRKIKPDLIFIQLNGFRSNSRLAYDVVLQAETGWISMTGTAEGDPAKLPVALIDIIAGHQLKEMALMGIIHKMRTGKGSKWQCTLEQASLSALANQATNFLMNQHVAKPIGTLHPNIAPYGDWFTTSDEVNIVLAVGSDAQFKGLCEVLGASSLADDSRFATNPHRLANREDLCGILQGKIGTKSFDSLAEALEVNKVPFGEIKSLDKVLATPSAKEMIREEVLEGRHTKRLSGNAFTFESF
jgi:crotonobetainyl-CoA:carnitine CoA-transferase CaiB-like acyl-CoA transferase